MGPVWVTTASPEALLLSLTLQVNVWPTFDGMLLGQLALVTFTVAVERLFSIPCSTSAVFTLPAVDDGLAVDLLEMLELLELVELLELPQPVTARAPRTNTLATNDLYDRGPGMAPDSQRSEISVRMRAGVPT